jgi:tryptophan-rich sensory protein
VSITFQVGLWCIIEISLMVKIYCNDRRSDIVSFSCVFEILWLLLFVSWTLVYCLRWKYNNILVI